MVNTKLLEQKITDSGKKKNYLAKKLNVSRPTFNAKIKGRKQFYADEVYVLCEELNITKLTEREKIFFAQGFTKI